MRALFLALAVFGFAVAGWVAPGGAVEIDERLMDLTEGPWTLSYGGQSCQITLGDEDVEGGRHLDGGAECSGLNPALAEATKWRIDVPHELVFLSDGGRVLAKMNYDEKTTVFTGVSASGEPLVMSQSE